MKQFATITVIGRDKTGVVARITNFLFLQKANIEALEEQVTRGQFSMTVQTSWKDRDLDRDAVAAAWRSTRRTGDGDQGPLHRTAPPAAHGAHGDPGTALL